MIDKISELVARYNDMNAEVELIKTAILETAVKLNRNKKSKI